MAARVVALGAHVPFGETSVGGAAGALWRVRETADGLDEEIVCRGADVVWSAGQRLRASFSAPSAVRDVAWTRFGEDGEEALCVLHEEGVALHRERGLGVPLAVPAPLAALWAVPGGLLLEAPGGALHSLVHPLAEARPVRRADAAAGRVCFAAAACAYVATHGDGQLTVARLERGPDPEAGRTYEAACALTDAPPAPAPDATLTALVRVPCAAPPAHPPFLVDAPADAAPGAALLCVPLGASVALVSLPPPAAAAAAPALLATHAALSAAPVRWQQRTALLLLTSATSLALLSGGVPVALVCPALAPLRRLGHAAGARVTLLSEGGAERAELRPLFAGGLARAVAAALERALPLPAAAALLAAAAAPPDAPPELEWQHLSGVLSAALLPSPPPPAPTASDEWLALLASAAHASPLNACATRHLAALPLPPHRPPPLPVAPLSPAVAAEVRARAGAVVAALHTLHEALKLDARRAAAQAALAELVAALAAALGLPLHADLVARDTGAPPVAAARAPPTPHVPAPFSLHAWLIACLTPGEALPAPPPAMPDELRALLRLYALLAGRDDAPLRAAHVSPAPWPPALSAAARVVLAMAEEGVGVAALDALPTGLSLPLREALYLARSSPPAALPPPAHALIGRRDLCPPAHAHAPPTPVAAALADEARDGLAPPHPVSALRFRADARLSELRPLLSSAATIAVAAKSGAEGDLQEQQAALLVKVHRTLALCVGRGAATLGATQESAGGAQTPLTVALDVPPLVTSGRVRGLGSPVQLDAAAAPADLTHWAEFHNGAAAALRLSADTEGVRPAWVAYQRPAPEASATHGGLLLGLGLAGHLGCLVTSQVQCAPVVYDYLRDGHELTSVGVMLGLGASQRGTMHGAVVKMLCVHLPPFHPPASAELDTLKDMPNVQAAALVGLGLVCQGSANRRMVEVLLDEIGRRPSDERRFNRESHALAAGAALGLICLGHAAPPGLADLRLFDRLAAYVSGAAPAAPAPAAKSSLVLEGKRGNPDVTAPAAMVALALMHMHTNDKAAAAPLALPGSFPALEVGRPDQLTLRVLCRHLILWDAVEPSAAWLDALPPPFLARPAPAAPPVDSYARRDDELHALARLHIRTGGALAVAFRFAGTQHPQAAALLLAELGAALARRPRDTDSKVLRAATETALALVAVSAAIVLSGSGDLRLLRLLRAAHRRHSAQVWYGHHLLTHMAVGFLFLGGGRLAFATTKEALAALLLAVYPALPALPTDNRHHLQALRHLYALAAEPRCVVCRDVDTQELCVVPLAVSLAPGFLPAAQTLSVTAPALLPPWTAIRALRLDTPRYFAREWDASALESLRRTRVILVRRRPGFLPHAIDPRGTLSLLSHPIPRARFSLPGLARHQKQSAVLRTFAADPALHAFAKHVCSEEEDADLAAFGNRILHECLANDSLDALPSLLALRQLLTRLPRERPPAAALLALRVALHFYSQPALLAALGPRDRRPPLLDAAAVADATSRVQAYFTQKGYLGGAQSAALLRKYIESGDVTDAAYGTFLSWHGLPSPHAIGAVRSGIPAGAPLPVAYKALQTRCGVSVPVAVLLLGALAK